MKSFHLLALAAAAGLCVATLSAQASAPQRPSGLLMGVVVDSSSERPVPGALVSVGRDRVLTDADGRFVFAELASGPYSVVAEKAGFLDGAYGRLRPAGPPQALTLATDERLADIRVLLWKHGAVSGAVTDEAGEPVVNARVDVLSRAARDGGNVFVLRASGWTDDRGLYRIGALGAGDHIVAAVGPPLPDTQALGPLVYPAEFYPGVAVASQAASVNLRVGDDRGGLDFRLKVVSAVRVSGDVIAPDGDPMAATLKLFVAGSDLSASAGFEVASTRSDKSGKFMFDAVPAGDYVLRASYEPADPLADPKDWPRPAWATLPLSVGTREIRDVGVPMLQGHRVSGRIAIDGPVRRPGGFRGMTAQIVPIDVGATAGQPINVDVIGRITVNDLPPGRYFVRVGSLPPGLTLKRVTVGGRDVTTGAFTISRDIGDLTITLTDRPSEISGLVRGSSGNPDTAATILIFPESRDTWPDLWSGPAGLRSIRAGRDGSYSVALPSGDYYVAAVADADAAAITDIAGLASTVRVAIKVTISDGEKRQLDLKTAGAVR